jgi:hypothetical protein
MTNGILNIMSKKKKIFLIILGVLVITGLLFLLYKTKRQPPTPPSPAKGELSLLDTEPPPGKTELFNPTIGITFNFDSPVKVSSANIVLTPYIPFAVEREKASFNSLVVRPKENWEYGVKYQITIAKGLTSTKGDKELKENIIYEIEFEYPPEDIIQIPPASI